MREILYLSRSDVESLGISLREVIDAVEFAFREKGLGRFEMPPKPGVYPRKDSFIHAMPSYMPGIDYAGLKWIAGYPENRRKGLPYITGLFILNEAETGLPLAVMDATWITAYRTGAATAVAAKYLANPDSRVLAILGCGVQGRSNAECLKEVLRSIEEIRAFDVNPKAAEKYKVEMESKLGVKVTVTNSPREALSESDVAVTAGPIVKDPKPVIEPEWFSGNLAVPLDFDSYWKPEAMRAMDKFITDDVNQLNYYRSIGFFKGIPRIYADLSEIIIGLKPGRESEEEKIMSMHLGLAIEDLVTGKLIYERAVKKRVGKWLPL